MGTPLLDVIVYYYYYNKFPLCVHKTAFDSAVVCVYRQTPGLCPCFMLKLWFDGSHWNVAPGFGGILSDSLRGFFPLPAGKPRSCGCYSRCRKDQSRLP